LLLLQPCCVILRSLSNAVAFPVNFLLATLMSWKCDTSYQPWSILLFSTVCLSFTRTPHQSVCSCYATRSIVSATHRQVNPINPDVACYRGYWTTRGCHRRLCVLKAKFHYASWFGAGYEVRTCSELVRSWFEAEIWPII